MEILIVIFFVFLICIGYILNYIIDNEIFFRRCKNCGSNKKEIKGKYWGFGKYEYKLYCSECGCQLEYNFGIPEDKYKKLLKKCKEKGIKIRR
ncbi:MAG: hypothetical protein J7K20_02065 [Thermodesulfobacterium sp.]|nr:hypothetical protein [Thermodesulfobacterium sp.]